MTEMPDAVEEKVKEPTPGSGFGVRHTLAFALCTCLTVNLLVRINLSVAVVSMTNSTRNDSYPVFDWTPEQKGMLLSSFFTGYLVSNLVASVIVTRFSNTKLLLWSAMYITVVSFLTPTLVTWGGYAVMFAFRVSMGLVQGFMMPITIGLLSKWIPINERSRCSTFVHGGLQLGTIISFVSSGFLSASPWGWPSIFYFSGVLTFLWCILWVKCAADSPEESKTISKEELAYIKSTTTEVRSNDSNKAIPWKMLFTNKCVYALICTMIGQTWGMWILITQIPSYFAHVVGLEMSQIGLLSATPFVSIMLVSIPVSYISDYLVSRKILSITVSRKLFNTIGQCGASAFLLCLAFTTSKALAVAFYTLAGTMITGTYVGYHINPLDIAPNYAGLLMGVTNGISVVAAICGPAFVGFVVKPLDNVQAWRLVFIVASAGLFIGNLIFVIFGSAEVQDFNYYEKPKPETDTEKSEKEPLKS